MASCVNEPAPAARRGATGVTANPNDAHHLHNGNPAQVSAKLGGERHHLRHRAGARAEQGGQRLPAVHPAQIAGSPGEHGHDRDHEQRHAQRPGRNAAKRLRGHHGPEQHAHHDEAHARQRERHPHRPSCQRGHGHRKHRSCDQRAGKSDELQQASPRRRDEQRLGDRQALELASGFVHIARCSCSPD